MKGGWIRVYRQLQDHWLWAGGRFTKGQAWIDLLLSANHRDRQTRLGNQLITVKRGQVLVSQRQLVSRWGWARTAVGCFANFALGGIIPPGTAGAVLQSFVDSMRDTGLLPPG